MIQSIIHIALVVKDYDEAIEFYNKKLRFNLIEDTYIAEQDKRWVVLSPPGSNSATILLAKASKEEQLNFIGNQAGGRVFLFLGTVAVLKDLYGNLWDLIQYKESSIYRKLLDR